MHTATLDFDMPNVAAATAVAKALEPELTDGPPGTQAQLSQEGTRLTFSCSAQDVSGLRALINGIIRLLDVAQRVQ